MYGPGKAARAIASKGVAGVARWRGTALLLRLKWWPRRPLLRFALALGIASHGYRA